MSVVIESVESAEVDPSDFMSLDEESSGPWLFAPNGRPIRVPGRAFAMIARYWSPGARGEGELLLDDDRGTPLIVQRTAGREDFCDLANWKVGRYRLFFVDEQYEPLRSMPAQLFITPKMAAARRGGEPVSAPSPAAPPAAPAAPVAPTAPSDLLRVLELVLAEQKASREQHSRQFEAVTSSLAGILSAAGGSGLFVRGDAKVALAMGATVPPSEAPRNAESPAAPANGNAPSTEAKANPKDEGEGGGRGGSGNALAEILRPLVERVAPVVAYGTARRGFDLDEEKSAELAGFSSSVVGKGLDMLTNKKGGEPPPAAPADSAPAPTAKPPRVAKTAAELEAHSTAIQNQLAFEDRAVLMQIGARHYARKAELEELIAVRTVDDAANEIRKVAAIWRTLDDGERMFLSRMIDKAGFVVLEKIGGERTVDDAVRLVRHAKTVDAVEAAARVATSSEGASVPPA